MPYYSVLPSQNAGQNCIGIERFLVHTSQHDELVRLFIERAQRLRFGPCLADAGGDGLVAPVDCGAMISRDRFEELERLIQDAAQEGADVVLGGQGWRHPYVEEGMYFSPTVVAGVAPTMELAQTESEYILVPMILVLPNFSGSVRSDRLHYAIRVCGRSDCDRQWNSVRPWSQRLGSSRPRMHSGCSFARMRDGIGQRLWGILCEFRCFLLYT